jgi:hypothetical protein
MLIAGNNVSGEKRKTINTIQVFFRDSAGGSEVRAGLKKQIARE